jgi:hypothetical protein
MSNLKIIVHCLVKNEENFIWYAINSVLPFVDKILVWDTGSEDKTIEIIKSIDSPKIEFSEKGSVNPSSFTKLRNAMLDVTDTKKYDWLLILDGDEIWPSLAMAKILRHIESNTDTQAIFVKTINSVGDIYHKQSQSAGHYHIKNVTGHLNLRFINLKAIPGVHVNLPYGREGYFTRENELVQDLPMVDFVDTNYLHTTHLSRSSLDNLTLQRKAKRKFENGENVSVDLLPEILFKKHPNFVPDVTQKMSTATRLRCLIETVPRSLHRIIYSFRNATD